MSAKIGTERQAGPKVVPSGQVRHGVAASERPAIRGRLRRRAVFLACTALVAAPLPAWAATYNASDAASLQAAIASVNAGSGTDTINITGNITLTSELPPITQGVTISGNGNTVSGNNQYRVFFVAAPSGAAVNISNVTLADGYAKGGNGGGGGGGGMGAGGAIFAMSGAITLTDVGFSGNRAQGGNGGTGATGGGGGLGGDGAGPGGFISGGGGGIGAGATGGTNSSAGGAGILPGAGGGSASSTGGGANGGGGGGSSAGSGGGGGGVGGGNSGGSAGGAGGFGGGGGGSGSNAAGNGGFGGGGGGGYQGTMTGGSGGFGGGGGSGINGAGGSAYGGGGGASTGIGGGGGGMGAGGAVFVCSTAITASCGATLTISNTTNKTVDGAVVAGTSNGIGGTGTAQGGAFFLSGAAGTFAVASGTTTTISSSIAGIVDSGIALTGGGTLALTNTGNSFNGVSVSGAGSTLSVAGPGSVTNTIRLGDQTRLLFAGGGSYSNALIATGVTSLDTGGVGNTVTYSGRIIDGTGAGAIDVTGGGTLVLSSIANSYSGGTTVKGNTTLSIGDQRVLGTGGLTLGDATSYGRLATTGTTFVSRAITLGQGGGEIAPANGTSLNLMGVISGSGALRMNGPGVLTLSASNTYSGGTEVAAGSLVVTVNDALGTGSITLADQTLFTIQNGLNIANAMKLRGTAGIRVASGDTSTYSGAIADEASPAGLRVDGGGTLILTGANSYSGGTSIVSGTLQIGAGGTSGLLSGNVSNSGALVFNRLDDFGYGGVISGTGTLTKSGAGILTLTGVSTYTGLTTINAGTLQLGSGGRIGSGSLTVASGATFDLNGNSQSIAGLSGLGSVTLGNGILTVDNATAQIFSGAISGAGSLTKSGTGTLTLRGENSFTGGTVLSAGTLEIDNSVSSASITGNVVNSGVLSFNAVSAMPAFGGDISGTGSVEKKGAGTLRLTGANTYSGATTISGGILEVSGGSAIGDLSAVSVASGAQFNLVGGNETVGSLAGAGSVDLGANLTVGGDGASTTFSGRITGSSSYGLTKEGTGSLTLSGLNSFNGATNINAGRLIVSGAAALSNNKTVTVASGATLELQMIETVGSLAGAGDVILGANQLDAGSDFSSTTFSGVISGSGSLSKGGSGVMTLTGENTYLGRTIIAGGTLQLGDNGTSGSVAGDVSNGRVLAFKRSDEYVFAGVISDGDFSVGKLEQNGSGTTTLTAANTYTNGTTINAGTLQLGNGGTTGSILGDVVVNSGATLAINRLDNYEFSGVISGDGRLVQRGSGTMTLFGASTYTGGTVIETGTVQVGNGGTSGSLLGDVVNNGELVFNRQDGLTFAGAISGTGALNKLSTGTLILTGSNSYAGGTTISAGTLQIGAGGTAGSITGDVVNSGILAFNRQDGVSFAGAISGTGALRQLGAGTLTLTGSNSYAGGTTISAGTLQIGNGGTAGSITGDVVNNGVLAFKRQDEVTFAGAISGAGALNQLGSGTLILTGSNSYAGGTTISAGTLQIGVGGTSGSIQGNVTVDSGGRFAINRQDSYTFAGSISGAGGFVQRGTGTTTLSGDATYSGGTAIEAGTLQIGNGGALNGFGSGDIANSGVFVVNTSSALTINGVISGTGSFESTGGTGGTGVTTLAGANIYTGTTTVSGGTLAVSGSLGSTAVAVNSGATLAGAGTIAGAVTIANGAHLAPGAPGSAGVLSVGSLGLSSGSLLDFDLGPPNTPAGSDRVDVTGNLVLDGTLNMNNAGSFGGGIYRLFSYGGTLTDNGLTLGAPPAGTLAADLSLQTSVTAEVNLVNRTGLALNFWDGGAAGNANNGLVDGGSGTWSAASGTWTDMAGSLNAPPGATPGFMIFQNAGGTVTVDGNAGAIAVTGMQFAADGYRIEGDPITLSGAQATIRVGDGSQGGAAYTATIASVLTGASDLVKSDLGTLVLEGANTYTGNTLLNAGTLSVSSEANLGDAAGGLVFNGGVLRVTGTGMTSTARTITWDTNGGGFDIAEAANSFTVGQALGGAGELSKLGAGTLVLTGANTYAGGTTISAGTLQIGNGGTTGAIAGNVVNNGVLAFKRQDDVTFAGSISGTGALSHLGAGALILTGNNSYAGGTTIASGLLQVGDGGTSGSVAGDIVNNGTLAFKRSDALTIAGTISGSGGLKQTGSGTTTLAGVNSYTGGTTISAGTLRGSATSFGSGTILNNGALIIDQPVNAVFANAIDGTGSLVKDGAGSLNLTGSGSFSGTTRVLAGRLAVNGSFGNSPFTVQSGGVLGGNGTIGGLTVNSGGIVAPGNSIGTLTVNGNVTLAPGSIYQVEIDGLGRSDMIVARGAITVSGATLELSSIDGTISPTARYELFSATGGVSGRFDRVNSSFAFLAPNISYDAGQTYLTVARNEVSFGSVGETRNQTGTAAASEQLGTGNQVYDALVKLDAPTARAAFDALSGEIHASAQGVLVDESAAVRSAAVDRLRSAFGSVGAAPMATMNYGFTADKAPAVSGPMPAFKPERFAVWGQGYGSWGHTDAEHGAAKLSRSTGGLIVGADVAVFDSLRFGLLAGYSRTEFEAKGRFSSGNSDNYHLGVYGGGQWGGFGLRTGASYTWHDVDTRRTVSFTGFGDNPRADYTAGTAQLFGELGYRVDLGRVALEPFAGLAYVNFHTDGFREQGGAAALNGASSDTGVGFSTLGLRASTSLAVQGMDLTLRGALAWRHAFGDTIPLATLAFSGSSAFTVAGIPIAKNAALVEAGIDLAISPNATLGVSYNAQLASEAQDHAFKANLAVRF